MSFPENFNAQIRQLSALADCDIDKDRESRSKALALAKSLVKSLEDPLDRAVNQIWQPWRSVAVRTAIDMSLFTQLASASGPKSTSELAGPCKGDVPTVQRILRTLAAMDFVKQASVDTWLATPTTKAMVDPGVAAGHQWIFDINVNSSVKVPKYLREVGYRFPSDPADGILQYAHHTKLNTFDYIGSRPDINRNFNTFMGNAYGSRYRFWGKEVYPIEERLLRDFSPHVDSALLIDIGGGKGHDIKAFHEHHPNKGRLILQELPHVVDSLDPAYLPKEIEVQAHSCFDEQPVKGARAYFIKQVLHDLPDKPCVDMLVQIRKAMKPGYSRLLINELILPDVGASEFECLYDLVMMTFAGGMQRSRGQWEALLDRAGLKVTKFWVAAQDTEGIIEAEVV